MCKPVVYLGGSFDPIHFGHLSSACELKQQLNAGMVQLLPAKLSPLKTSTHASNEQRVQLLKLALSNYPSLKLDTREIERESASYTLLTLQELRQEYGEEQPLVFAMGMDSFIELHRWFRWQELTNYAHLVIFSRPGYKTKLTPELRNWLAEHQVSDSQPLAQSPNGKVWLTELSPVAISSTQLRLLCQQPDPVVLSNWMPEQVIEYIIANRLYT